MECRSHRCWLLLILLTAELALASGLIVAPGEMVVVEADTASVEAALGGGVLLPDGGFEQGGDGWYGGTVVTDQPHGGEHCLLVDDGDESRVVAAYPLLPALVTPGGTYRFEAWVRTEQAEHHVLIGLAQYDERDEWIAGGNHDLPMVGDRGWQRIELVVRALDSRCAGLRVFLYPTWWAEDGSSVGRAWFDDLSLRPVAAETGRSPSGSWLRRSAELSVWSAPVEHKVERDRPLAVDAADSDRIRLAAAGNESEAVQLVLTAADSDQLVAAELSSFLDRDGHPVNGVEIELREVSYVEVTRPTDLASITGWRPDPLPVLELPLELPAQQQQPLWLQVRLPPGLGPRSLSSQLRLELASGAVLELPVEVRVWGFDLPDEHHLRTAYGLSLEMIDRYHHLDGDRDARRETFRHYLSSFADHRISPYDPIGDDAMTVDFGDWNWLVGVVVDDPAAGAADNHVLEVVDEHTDRAVCSSSSLPMPATPGVDVQVSWRARTDGAHEYMVVLRQYGADGGWIFGHNIDLTGQGDGSWRGEQVTVPADLLHPSCASLSLGLYARAWTPDGALTGRTWFDDLEVTVAGGDNLVVNGDFELELEEVELTVHTADFDAAARLALDELQLDSFRLDLPGFGWGQLDWFWPGRLLGLEWGTAEHEALFAPLLRLMTDHLATHGWLDRAYAFWFDEPYPQMYETVVTGMSILARADSRLRRLLTVPIEPQLVGSVDIWVVPIGYFTLSGTVARQAAGDEVWWYVACSPTAPYPNQFIDHGGIGPRVRAWMAWQYGVEGEVYWDTTYWTNDQRFPPPSLQDPWSDPRSYNQNDTWGNGEGRLLYPPRQWQDGQRRIEGPVPSQRWELLREGLEDYEYFWLLSDAVERLERRGVGAELAQRARNLLEVPAEIVGSPYAFTDDPSRLAEHRLELAEALEQARALLEPREAAGRPSRSGVTPD